MAFSIRRAIESLQEDTAYQRLPEPISVGQYENMILRAIKRLYVDTGRALVYDMNNYSFDEREGFVYNEDLPADEEEYVMICALINFYKRVQTDANNVVSYSTNAIKVTGADKPYANLQRTIDDLEARRRELFYRMPRYTMGYDIAD